MSSSPEAPSVPLVGEKADLSRWRIVAACFVILLIHAGVGFYALGLFVKPLEKEFAWSRTSIEAMAVIYFVVMGLAGPLVGRGVDIYGGKRVVLASALVMGAGLALLSFTRSLGYLYVMSALFTVGLAGTSAVPISAIVSTWFGEKRGVAMGLALAGIGIGGLLLAPGLNALITSLGWRQTYRVMAILAVMVTTLAALFIKGTPRLPRPREGAPIDSGRGNLGKALATPSFWLITLAFLGAALGAIGVLLNQVAYLTDQGISSAVASTALGLTAGMGALGKLFFGSLADRIPTKYAAALSFSLQALGVLLLMQTDTPGEVWAFVVVFGFGMGGVIALQPLILGEHFGLAFFATLFGTFSLVISLGSATGPLFTSLIYDTTGSYAQAFSILLVIYAVAIGAILATRRRKPQHP